MMAKHRYSPRRCPDCGWMFTPTSSVQVRCRICGTERNRVVRLDYSRQHAPPPMPLRERLCICGQVFHAHQGKRCPACQGYRYANVPHVWFKDLVKLSDDPDWRRMSLEEWHQLNDEMDSTMRRAQAAIDEEKELAGQAQTDKQERLARILGGLGTGATAP